MKTAWIASAVTVQLLVSLAPLAQARSERVVFQRDSLYEQSLRYRASADQTITPAKILRWVMGLRGVPARHPSNTEFQPTVKVNESAIRIIAAIAYKF